MKGLLLADHVVSHFTDQPNIRFSFNLRFPPSHLPLSSFQQLLRPGRRVAKEEGQGHTGIKRLEGAISDSF